MSSLIDPKPKYGAGLIALRPKAFLWGFVGFVSHGRNTPHDLQRCSCETHQRGLETGTNGSKPGLFNSFVDLSLFERSRDEYLWSRL
jgi:hypothetical protein